MNKMANLGRSMVIGMTILLVVLAGCEIGNYKLVKVEGDTNTAGGEPSAAAETQESGAGPAETAPQAQETEKVDKESLIVENTKNRAVAGEDNSAPTVMLTEPDGGEIIKSGKFEIWWKASDSNGDALAVKLEYDDNGKWVTIADNEANDRTYLWDLSGIKNGAYRMRITVNDGKLSAGAVNAFEISR